MLRRDFQQLALLRVREAKALAAQRCFDGAYYLGGLGIECALKSCIARATKRFEFPEKPRVDRIYTHRLDILLKESGLESELIRAKQEIQENWAIIKEWRIDFRYSLGRSQAECEAFLAAITGRNGVQWLKRAW